MDSLQQRHHMPSSSTGSNMHAQPTMLPTTSTLPRVTETTAVRTSQSRDLHRRLATTLNNAGVLFSHLNNSEYALCRYQESLQIRMRLAAGIPDETTTTMTSGPSAQQQQQSEHSDDYDGVLSARYEETRRELGELSRTFKERVRTEEEAPLLDLYPVAGLPGIAADSITEEEGEEELAPCSPLLIPATHELLSAEEDDRNVATTLFNMGLLHGKNDSIDAATNLFEMALRKVSKSRPRDAFLTAIILNAFAKIEYQRGQSEKSISLLRDALRCHQGLARTTPQEKHASFTARRIVTQESVLADKFSLMGRIHYVLGNTDESLELSSEALKLRRNAMLDDRVGYACSLWNMGLVLALKKDTRGAIKLMEEFINVCQEGAGAAGADARTDAASPSSCLLLPQIATAQHTIGLLHLENCSVTSAVTSLKIALNLRRRSAGENHPSVATSYFVLASVMNQTGRYREALTFGSESLRIRRSNFGPEAKEVGVVLGLLASIHQDIGDFGKALALYGHLLKIARSEVGNENVFVANILEVIGELHLYKGESEEAVSKLIDSARIRRRLHRQQQENYGGSLPASRMSNGIGDDDWCAVLKTVKALVQSYPAAAAA